jgi:hypothetical protein
MEILFESDSTSIVDIDRSGSVLASLCKNIKFTVLSPRQVNEVTPKFIDLIKR